MQLKTLRNCTLITLLLVAIQVFAQYSHEFIQIARTSQYGKSEHVFFGADSVLYVAKSQAGLRAYTVTDSSIDKIGAMDEGQLDAIAQDVTILPDGTIMLANGLDGFRTYQWQGSSLENVAHIQTQNAASGIAVGPDSTLYLATDNDSLHAYRLYDHEFLRTMSMPIYGTSIKLSIAQDSILLISGEYAGLQAYLIDDSAFVFLDYALGTGNVRQFYVADNGIIYTANHNNGIDAYSFENSRFHLLSRISTNGEAMDIVAMDDGRIIVANTSSLQVYTWEDSTFVFQSESGPAYYAQDITITDEGDLIVACGFNGLRKFSLEENVVVEDFQVFDGEQCIAQAAALGSEGIVFSAETRAGIGVYRFTGDSLRYLSQFDNNRGMVMDLTVLSDTNVFAGNRSGGLDALHFDGVNLTEIDNVDDGGFANWVTHDPNSGEIFLSTVTEGLWAYRLQGDQLINDAMFDGPGGSAINNIEVVGEDTLLIAQDYYGITMLSFNGTEFDIVAQLDTIGAVVDVAQAADGTIYTANHDAGLWAFRFNNNSFEYLADTSAEGDVDRVEVLPNGDIITVIRDVGIRAYHFDGVAFTVLAQIDRSEFAGGITIDSTGLIYSSASFEGLIIYELNSIQTDTKPELQLKPQSVLIRNYPNPFNPTTTIRYSIPEQSHVKLTVFDIGGREIMTLQEGFKAAGSYETEWNGMNNSGNQVSTGLYLCRLQAGNLSSSIKMVYLR